MYRQPILLIGAGLLGLVHAQLPQITAAPKMPKRHIEIHKIYAAPIGVDTDYLTMEGTSTKWVPGNTEYLSEVVSTTTIDNVETTTTVKQQLAVVTATEESDGIGVGDVTVLMADTVQKQLDSLIKEVAASCAAPVKLRKRDAMSCAIPKFQQAAQNDEALALINPEEWNGFILEAAQDAPAILLNAIQVMKTQAQRNKFMLIWTAVGAAGGWAGFKAVNLLGDVPYKLFFDDGKVGSGLEEEEGDDDTETPVTTTQLATTTTTTGCDPSATVDENSPACDDEDCQGESKVCKAEGDKNNCPCVKWAKKINEGLFDKDWSDAQQEILKELESALPDVLPPQCFRNSYGDNFDGEPVAEPSAFCRCSSISMGGGVTEGNYATMTGEGDQACTYSTMPTETISITMMTTATAGPVTSCRVESSYSVAPYCTCNDNSMHAQITTTYLGQETTVCPDATPTMTSAMEEPTCFPTHGPPHDDPDKDQILKLCGTGEKEFRSTCNDGVGPNRSVFCPNGNGFSSDPIFQNSLLARFDKAADAPPDCDHIFVQVRPGEPDNSTYVDSLCIPAFQAILEKCPWNGGEVTTECGKVTFQSCPNSGCTPGNPQGITGE